MHIPIDSESVATDCNEAKTQALRGHKLALTCVCIDSKDQCAFTASKDGSIIKWSIETRKILGKIYPTNKKDFESSKSIQNSHHLRHINCLAISSDDKFLASGGHDKHIRIWSPKDLTWIHTFTLHKQEITALAFRLGYPTLFSASVDRSIMLWTLEEDDNRCFVESLHGHESGITSIDVLKKERVISSGGRDQSVRIWKLVEQAQTVFASKHESVDVVKFIDDKTFVSGGEDGAISVWTTMKRTPVCTIANAHLPQELTDEAIQGLKFWISALAKYSPNEVVVKNAAKKMKLDDDVLVSQIADEDEEEEDASDDDDREGDRNEGDEDTVNEDEGTKGMLALLASGSCDSKIRLWKLLKAGSSYSLKLHQTIDCPGFVNDLKFSKDGRRLLAACGQEHKFGRWWRLKKAKNCMRIFDVNKI